MAVDPDILELVRQFKDETDERLQSLADGILALEASPGDAELLKRVFRDAHTIKGNARLIGIANAAAVAHAIEDVLEIGRGAGRLNGATVGSLLEGVDLLQRVMDRAAEGVVDGELTPEVVSLTRRLAGPTEGTRPASEAAAADCPQAPRPVLAAPGQGVVAEPELPGAAAVASAEASQRVSVARLGRIAALASELTTEASKGATLLERLHALRQLAKGARTRRDPGPMPSAPSAADSARAWQLLRLCLSDLTTIAATAEDLYREYEGHSRANASRVSELSAIATETRLVPVRALFAGLRRNLRDLGQELGKPVQLIIEGDETAVERRIIEELRQPLQHVLRNAIDHGVEDAATRRTAGKPEMATITLRAYPRGDYVVVEVADDGRGLDPRELRETALKGGLLSREQLERMEDHEALALIFEPGLSTRPNVSTVSGRGVGLDAVRACVDGLDGRTQVSSVLGQGTTLRLELPLNLWVVRALLVAVGEQRFAIPSNAVTGVARAEQRQRSRVGDTSIIVLDGVAFPVLDVAALCGLTGQATRGNDAWAVLVGHGGRRVACLVDEILAEEQVAIAPLGRFFASVTTTSAATILGDGSVAVLLPSEGVLAAVGLGTQPAQTMEEAVADRPVSVLVVDDSRNTRELLRSVLEASGHVVELAANGVDGLEKARAQAYDLVVTDVEMPLMDGFELTAQLRADERYLRTPIIVVTTRDTPADRRRGLAAGATAYFIKAEFDQNRFLDVVRKAVA